MRTHAHAQQNFEAYKKPIPEIESLSEEVFQENTRLYEEKTVFGDKELAYSMRLPMSWEKVEQTGVEDFLLSSKVFGQLAKFYSPLRSTGARSRFEVQAVALDHQLTVEQWLLQHLLSNGYVIQGMNVYSEKRAEAVYVLLERDLTYIVRTIAEISGKNIVMATYYLPIEYWNERKKIQAQVISSFALTDSKIEIVEEMAVYQFLDIAEISYPKSWQLRASPLSSIDRMDVRLLNVVSKGEEGEPSVLDGKIEVYLVSDFIAEGLGPELEAIKQNFSESGFVLKTPVDMHGQYEFNEAFKYNHIEAYSVESTKNKTIRYELWLAMMHAEGYYYFVTLLTPAREQDYFVWAKNTQTYEVVLQMIRLQDGSLVRR